MLDAHVARTRRSEHWGRRAVEEIKRENIFDPLLSIIDGAGNANGNGNAKAKGPVTSTPAIVKPTVVSPLKTPAVPTLSIFAPHLPDTTPAVSSTSSSSSASSVSSTQSTSTSSSIKSSSSSSIASKTTSKTSVAVSTHHVVTSTATKSVSSLAATNSVTATGATANTGAVVGGVMGGIAALAILVAILMYFVRKHRQKKLDREVFDAAFFRRSAIVLDDPPKNDQSLMNGYNPPPTMVQHNPSSVSTRAAPSPAPPAPSPVPYNQNTYAQQQPYAGYNNYSQPAMYAQQPSFSPGQVMPQPPTSAYGAAGTMAAYEGQPDVSNIARQPPAGYLTRQPSDGSNGHHGAMTNPWPQSTSVPMTRGVSPSAPVESKRPETVYDEDDAYGGI